MYMVGVCEDGRQESNGSFPALAALRTLIIFTVLLSISHSLFIQFSIRQAAVLGYF